MKKLLALMLIFSMFFVMGCSEDEVDEFDTLVTYLEGDNGGYINNMGSWIKNSGNVGATETKIDFADYTVLDLRKVEDFTPMHIADAINVNMTTMFDEAENATKPILVTCYSGQSASYAHTLLRIKGYEAYVMKFGMSAYDATLDKWTDNCKETYAGDLVTTASPTLPSFDYPELDTGEKDAEDILEARIDEAIAAWSAGMLINASDVFGSEDSYNIMNYWTNDNYTGYGHVNGSYQLDPNTLSLDENLSVFDPEGGNVLYCWTGQTAAASIAYLKVIGYDVKSIKFGFNIINWAGLSSHKWPKPYSN